MQIQISWLLQKPTDLDLHCLLRQGMSCLAREGLRWVTWKIYQHFATESNFCRKKVASFVFEIFQIWGLLLKEIIRIQWSRFNLGERHWKKQTKKTKINSNPLLAELKYRQMTFWSIFFVIGNTASLFMWVISYDNRFNILILILLLKDRPTWVHLGTSKNKANPLVLGFQTGGDGLTQTFIYQ